MKTPTSRWFSTPLPLIILLAGAPLANAYYDPGIQRWINRDPIGESGFRLLSETRKSQNLDTAERYGDTARPLVADPYRFVGNDPTRYVDSYGLETMAECWTDCMNTLVPFPLKVCGAFAGLTALAAKVAGAATVAEVALILPVWASGAGVGCYLGCLASIDPPLPPNPNPWWPRPPGY